MALLSFLVPLCRPLWPFYGLSRRTAELESLSHCSWAELQTVSWHHRSSDGCSLGRSCWHAAISPDLALSSSAVLRAGYGDACSFSPKCGCSVEAGPIRGERRHSTCTPGRSGAVSHRPGHHVFPHPVPREPSSSWTASTSRHWAFQSEVARSDLGGTWRKGGNPLGSRREGKRGTPGPLLPPQEHARSQSTGCEPATACLEGRWSQDRRLLPVKWL